MTRSPDGVGPQSTDEVAENVVAGLVTALTSAAPPVCARHRWTGGDVSTDALGICGSVVIAWVPRRF